MANHPQKHLPDPSKIFLFNGHCNRGCKTKSANQFKLCLYFRCRSECYVQKMFEFFLPLPSRTLRNI